MVRKCIRLSILLAATFLFCGIGSAIAQGSGDIIFNEYVKNESTYLAQKIKFPRSSFHKPFTLGEQLSDIFGEMEYTSAVVVQQWMGGSMSEKFDNPQKLLDMDPVFLCCEKDGEWLKFKQPDITATVMLDYREDSTGLIRTMTLHFNPRGFPRMTVYTRTSIMVPSQGEDDLRSTVSESSAAVASYLTAFDVAENTETKERFSQVLASTVHKDTTGEDMNAAELSCKKGLDEYEDLESSLLYGQRLLQDQKLYDGYVALAPVFSALKNRIRPDTAIIDGFFYNLAAGMGACRWALGNFDSADYFFGLVEDMADSVGFDMGKYNEDRMKAPALMDGTGTYLGQVLPILFDLDQHCLIEGVVDCGGDITRITDKNELWNFNLKDLCTSGVSKMVVSYTRAMELTDVEEIVDQSNLCNFNNLIITVEQVTETLSRVNIMHPHFKRFDYKSHPDSEINRPVVKSFIISHLPVEQFGTIGKKADKKKIEKKLVYAASLMNGNRHIEAAIASLQLCWQMERLPQKQLQNDKIKELYTVSLYLAGYMLAEVDMPYKAIAYLRKSTKLLPTYSTMSEYIANLCNVMDPRAFHLIVEEMRDMQNYSADKSPEKAEYERFLTRRMAYMLIEYKAYNQAEQLLTAMLEDPQSADFARHELEYIRLMREEEGM